MTYSEVRHSGGKKAKHLFSVSNEGSLAVIGEFCSLWREIWYCIGALSYWSLLRL